MNCESERLRSCEAVKLATEIYESQWADEEVMRLINIPGGCVRRPVWSPPLASPRKISSRWFLSVASLSKSLKAQQVSQRPALLSASAVGNWHREHSKISTENPRFSLVVARNQASWNIHANRPSWLAGWWASAESCRFAQSPLSCFLPLPILLLSPLFSLLLA